jgi:hypothetical protein
MPVRLRQARGTRLHHGLKALSIHAEVPVISTPPATTPGWPDILPQLRGSGNGPMEPM